MKKPLLPFLLCLLCSFAHAQDDNNKLIYLDAAGAPVKAKHAKRLRQINRLNDSLYEINLYKMDGPRISSIQSNTADGAVPDGYWISYDARGYADTIGHFDRGERDGYWTLKQEGRYLGKQYYEHNKLIWQKDSAQLHREWLDDSAKAVAAGKPNVFQKAGYPGGDQGWLRYLIKHLRYPDEAVDKGLMGMVWVTFSIDQDGELRTDPLLVVKSVAYSLDRESLAVISESGLWEPEVRFGEKVKTWRTQPVVYQFSKR